ncbi:hypothetical protein MRX96_013024 [Rhipicephalus microplus]
MAWYKDDACLPQPLKEIRASKRSLELTKKHVGQRYGRHALSDHHQRGRDLLSHDPPPQASRPDRAEPFKRDKVGGRGARSDHALQLFIRAAQRRARAPRADEKATRPAHLGGRPYKERRRALGLTMHEPKHPEFLTRPGERRSPRRDGRLARPVKRDQSATSPPRKSRRKILEKKESGPLQQKGLAPVEAPGRPYIHRDGRARCLPITRVNPRRSSCLYIASTFPSTIRCSRIRA